jgi:hypothetical protein
MLLDTIAYIVAVFWDFQFFPDTLPLLDGAKKAIGADEVLSTVAASPIVILLLPLNFVLNFPNNARCRVEESNRRC